MYHGFKFFLSGSNYIRRFFEVLVKQHPEVSFFPAACMRQREDGRPLSAELCNPTMSSFAKRGIFGFACRIVTHNCYPGPVNNSVHEFSGAAVELRHTRDERGELQTSPGHGGKREKTRKTGQVRHHERHKLLPPSPASVTAPGSRGCNTSLNFYGNLSNQNRGNLIVLQSQNVLVLFLSSCHISGLTRLLRYRSSAAEASQGVTVAFFFSAGPRPR